MKRNMDLIRLLLLEIEGEPPAPNLSTYTEEQKLYHKRILIESGLLRGVFDCNDDGTNPVVFVSGLTWRGHEFLDTARNESVWKQAMERIKDAGVQVALPVLHELLTVYVKKHLGL